MTYQYTFGGAVAGHVGDPPPVGHIYVGDPPGTMGCGMVVGDYNYFPYDRYGTRWYPNDTYTTDRIELNPAQDQYKIGYRDGFKDGYRAALESLK